VKLLIDECLSPELVDLAQARGHEASHVVWLGKSGWKDWSLKPFILDGDWTFVTCNSADFRGPRDRPGSRGQYANVALHAGLVCLNPPKDGLDLDLMIELFEAALDEIASGGELVNQVLEISVEGDELDRVRYDLPKV
jgi:hypothetical protein